MGVVAYPVRELDLVHALLLGRLWHNRCQLLLSAAHFCTQKMQWAIVSTA